MVQTNKKTTHKTDFKPLNIKINANEKTPKKIIPFTSHAELVEALSC